MNKQQEYNKLLKRYKAAEQYYSTVDIETNKEAQEYEPKLNEIIKRLGELSKELHLNTHIKAKMRINK